VRTDPRTQNGEPALTVSRSENESGRSALVNRRKREKKRRTSIAFWALFASNLEVILAGTKERYVSKTGLSVVSDSSSDLPPSLPAPTVARQSINRTASIPSFSFTTTTTTFAFWMPTSQTNVPPDMIRSPSAVTREEDEEVKPYVVVAEIGKGSFATVYKGYHSVSPNTGQPK